MERGEAEFLIGMILMPVGAIIASASKPASIVLLIIGIVLILCAAFDTGTSTASD